MLVRNLTDESFYTEGDRTVSEMLQYTYAQAITINQSFWSEADIDTRFKVGDQSLWNDYYGNLPAARRKQFYFNRIQRVCNMVTGYQRRNRKSTITAPIEHTDEKASSQWTKLLFHAMKRANCDNFISTGFEKGSVTTGMALGNVWMDYSRDPESGDAQVDIIPYNSFLIDPYFQKPDLSDCNFIWRRQWLSKQAVMAISPKALHGYIEQLRPRGNRDGKFQYQPQAYNYGMQDLLSYDEYWYKDTRRAKFLVDTENRLSREWTGEDKDLKLFLQAYPQLAVRDCIIPTVKLAIQCEGKTIYHGANPLGIDRYPFVAFLGYYEPDIPYFPWRVRGMVRGLRDSQFLYNRRKVIELDILESQVNSGFIYKPSSMVNPRDIYMEGQGKGIPLKQEAEMTDIREITPGQIPPSMIQLSELLGREIMEISGVNEELLGSAQDDKAGILSMLRQGAGLTTLQGLFDQLEFTQKQLGELFLQVIQKNYSQGKVERILGEKPVDDFKNRLFLDYDVRVEEGVNTTTQRQLEFAQLIHLREAGLPIPTRSILRAATVQDKEELIKDIEQEEQQTSQAQQMQMQAQMQLLAAQVEDLQSRAVANTGLGVERMSRLQENELLAEERRAQAIENISDARLNRAKMLKELEELDITQIEKLLALAQMLRTTESERQELVPQQVTEAPALGGLGGGEPAPGNLSM